MLQERIARVAEQVAARLVDAGDERTHAVLDRGVQEHGGVVGRKKLAQFADIGGLIGAVPPEMRAILANSSSAMAARYFKVLTCSWVNGRGERSNTQKTPAMA